MDTTRLNGIILLCTNLLGIVMTILGVIGTVMYLFNIQTGLDTKFILGIFALPLTKSIIQNRGDRGKAKQAENKTDKTPKLEEGGYTISEREVRIDLQNRREIGWIEFHGSDLSETERIERRVIKGVGSGVEELNFLHATSGHSIVVIDKPEGAKWRKVQEKSGIYHPFYDLIKGDKSLKKFLKDLIARKGRMRTYYMTVPITEGSGQEIIYKVKYHNAFQGRDFEWAGEDLSADTDILTMHIVFPEDKPFKSFETSKKETTDAPRIQIDNPEIETAPDNHTLTWTIRDAKKGEQYYIKWLW
jgi:hypothetical protein